MVRFLISAFSTVVIPFLDEIIQELNCRFSAQSRRAVTGLLNLVPSQLMSQSSLTISDVVHQLEIYEADCNRFESLSQELQIWKNRLDLITDNK